MQGGRRDTALIGEEARFVVLTGLSGSGKSAAIRALEDLGYFCVENLPTSLIASFADLAEHKGGRIKRAAVVVDMRTLSSSLNFRWRSSICVNGKGSEPLSSFSRPVMPPWSDASPKPEGRIQRGPTYRCSRESFRSVSVSTASGVWPTRSSTRPT